MKHKFKILTALICFVGFAAINLCLAQVKEEKEEKFFKMEKLRVKPAAFKMAVSAGLFTGYDSNVNLRPAREGDVFQEFLLSADFIKPWIMGTRFSFNYDLGVLNYSEITDATNILNHLRFAAHKKLGAFETGTGYDLSILYYPNDDEDFAYNNDKSNGDFLFHKCFYYIKHNISGRLFHQILVEAGYKDYTNRKALQDSLTTLQDKERVDHRQLAEYSIGLALPPKMFFKLRGRAYRNDSNARYLDFYDYNVYDISPGLDFRAGRRLTFYTSFIYTRKNYKSRLVTSEAYKQKDDIYYANIEARYKIWKESVFSLMYTYRGDNSNDSLEKYTENVMTLGWQYNF